ncbi:MAG: helix-turn-helix domain-containing protein [Candidatus Marinimicrobia bacterium]|nr:helix-turn-helix domain-containing protein [Candidatus Neomarinimicrobiota bacterium]
MPTDSQRRPGPSRAPAAAAPPDWPLTAAVFDRLNRAYRRRHGVGLVAVDSAGRVVHGRAECGVRGAAAVCRSTRRRIVDEALRWGEPALNLCRDGVLNWGVPLMRNQRVVGGLVIDGLPLEPPPGRAAPQASAIRAACADLLDLAVAENLTNGALLEQRRQSSGRERERAEAIHAVKDQVGGGLRGLYLREEPALLAAVKRGDAPAARQCMNRLLVGLGQTGLRDLAWQKSLALELVVMLYRGAVEAGAQPARLLGLNYASVQRLAAIADEEALRHWLEDTLERLLAGLGMRDENPVAVRLQRAQRYLQTHCARSVTRAEVARVAGMSPSHFSHTFGAYCGHSFREALLRCRLDLAAEKLRRTHEPIAAIALECGFCDQSHFGKAFRRHTGCAPSAYRRGRGARQSLSRALS